MQPYDEIPPGDLSGERFLTFSLCDTPAWDSISGSGASCWDETYGPEHEEGNLFSYPSHVEDTPGYEERQEGPVVTRPDSFNVSGGEKKYLKVESASEDVAAQTSQTNVNAGFGVVGNIGVPDVGFGLEILAEGVDIKLPKIDIFGFEVAPNFIWNKTQMDVSTKTYETSESFEVDPGGQGLPCTGTDHKVSAAFFVDPAGAMNVAFGVDLLTDTAEPRAAWRRDGMYGDRPDPALVLPERFTYDRKAGLWSSEPDKWSATQLRGIRFWDELAKTWTTSCLAQDGQYRIQVPLYNASFKDAGDVTVEMSIRRHHSEDVVKVLGRKTAHLGGWPNNKAKVSFDLSGADLLGLDPHEAYHDLCFVLDPDGEIEELHEEWGKEADGGDPGGNNVGRYPIGVIHSRPMYTSGDVTCYADGSETPVRTKATAAAAAAAGEEGFTVWFEPVREDDARTRLSVAEFRQELAEQTESFRAHGWVRYNGPGPLTGLHVTVAHLESDGSRQIIARKIVPALYPDREYPFSFIVSPGTVEKEKFIIDVAGHGVSLRWPHEDERPTPDDQPDDEGSSSGGGCSTHAGTSAGLGGLALLALGALLLRGRDRK